MDSAVMNDDCGDDSGGSEASTDAARVEGEAEADPIRDTCLEVMEEGGVVGVGEEDRCRGCFVYHLNVDRQPRMKRRYEQSHLAHPPDSPPFAAPIQG